MTIRYHRKLKQQAERCNSSVAITYSNQPANDRVGTPSSSVDIVIFCRRPSAWPGIDWIERAASEDRAGFGMVSMEWCIVAVIMVDGGVREIGPIITTKAVR